MHPGDGSPFAHVWAAPPQFLQPIHDAFECAAEPNACARPHVVHVRPNAFVRDARASFAGGTSVVVCRSGGGRACFACSCGFGGHLGRDHGSRRLRAHERTHEEQRIRSQTPSRTSAAELERVGAVWFAAGRHVWTFLCVVHGATWVRRRRSSAGPIRGRRGARIRGVPRASSPRSMARAFRLWDERTGRVGAESLRILSHRSAHGVYERGWRTGAPLAVPTATSLHRVRPLGVVGRTTCGGLGSHRLRGPPAPRLGVSPAAMAHHTCTSRHRASVICRSRSTRLRTCSQHT